MGDTALRGLVGIALSVALLSGCSWSAAEPTLTSDGSSAPPGVTVEPTVNGTPIASNGPLSAGLLNCPVAASALGPNGEPAQKPASTPVADVDLQRPVIDGLLCVGYSNRSDGTNRGVERRRVPLGDLSQLRVLAHEAALLPPRPTISLPPDTPVSGPLCVRITPRADTANDSFFAILVEGRETPEVLRVEFECPGAGPDPGLAVGSPPLEETPQLRRALDRVVYGSVDYYTGNN